MTRTAAAAVAAALAVAGVPDVAASASASAVAPPRAALVGFACRDAHDPELRRVAVTSVMRPVTGTRTLSVRFELIETAPGAAPTPVIDGDLGQWLTPAVPTLGRDPSDVWKLAKAVYDVPAPARYRFRVDFRWVGDAGRVLATHTVRTTSCAEREPRAGAS